MTTLVEDLLLLARLDAGRPLERGDVDLTRLVVDARQRRPRGRARTTAGSSTCPRSRSSCTGDTVRLTQVLANLLANARTHTPPGTTVTVGLGRSDGGARLTVVDDGPGHRPGPAAARVRAVRPRVGVAVPARRQHRARPGDRGRGGGRARRHRGGAQPARAARRSRCGCRTRGRVSTRRHRIGHAPQSQPRPTTASLERPTAGSQLAHSQDTEPAQGSPRPWSS